MARRPWHDAFFAGLYARVLPATFSEAATLRQAATVARLLRLRPGQRVLDVPCGQGRLSVPLARRGLRVTGVDLQPSYLRQARRAARQAGVEATFLCRDMRQIDFEGHFDAAFNWFGSFGYFSDGQNLRFCQAVWRALRPGGKFLVEGLNRSWVLRHFHAASAEEIGGVGIAHRNRWDAPTHRLVSRWVFTRGGRRESHTARLRLFSGAEGRALLEGAGFIDVRLWGYRPLGPYSAQSPRWVAVARRP